LASPEFLDKEEILFLHSQQIEFFGGSPELENEGLLDSAVLAPINYFYYTKNRSLFDLAGCYAFHLTKNHAFKDGNKRVGLSAALTFLDVNGIPVEIDKNELFDAMTKLTTSEIDKLQFGEFLRASSPLHAAVAADLFVDD
jgi:death on curing protein